MSELPKGWITSSIFDIATPKQWKTISKKLLTDEGYDVYGANGIIGKFTEYTHENPTLMITCRGATCGNVHISKPKSYINGNAMALDGLSTSVNIYYLYYFLKFSEFKNVISGSAQPQITQEGLTKLQLVIAPINEQIRIANKLDSILSKVDKAQARLNKIPAILKRFRQSVLAAATSGELTKEWREEMGFEWEANCLTVEQIAKKEKYSLGIGPFGSNLKVADYRNEGHPLVFVREIRARQFGGAGTKFVDHNKFSELAAHRAKPGNILITKMGGPPGDVAIYPDALPEAVITSDCIKLDVNEELASKQYVFYYMQSEHFQLQIRAITAGVAQQKVNLKNFKSLGLLMPSLEEQNQIISRITTLVAKADKVEKQYLDAKARLDRLTQSILAKAFRGELVPQDPNDEPAEQLLERILKERLSQQQKADKPKKTTKKRTIKTKVADKG